MTDIEIKLLNMIRNHTHPNEALEIALNIICLYLAQSQSFATPSVADSQELT